MTNQLGSNQQAARDHHTFLSAVTKCAASWPPALTHHTLHTLLVLLLDCCLDSPLSPHTLRLLLAAVVVQLVIVWAAPDATHPSFADAKRLAAALWAQGGPATPSPLALLRARAEAAAAAKGGGSGSSSSAGSSSGSSVTRTPGSAVVVKRGLTGVRGAAAAAAGDGSDRVTQQQQTPLLHSVWVNFQPHPDSNRVLGDSWQLMHGAETGWQEFGGVQLAVQPGSFVQVGGSEYAGGLPAMCEVCVSC